MTCPFCNVEYVDALKHAVKAHKGQTITLSINPLDTSHSVTMFGMFDRIERHATRGTLDADDLEVRLDWSILAALIRALRRDATINETTA